MNDEREYEKEPLRDRLLVAGMGEIATHGVADFSLRRVASACHISCAAPYRHFASKEDFIREIVRYIDSQWALLRDEVLRIFAPNVRRQLCEVAVAYARFFAANPHYGAVLSAAGENAAIKEDVERLIRAYCDSFSAPDWERERYLYELRALIYGTTAMLASGELPNDASTYDRLRAAIEARF